MPIPTDVTIEDTFEVVDPIDVAPVGSDPQAYVETGLTPLVMGQQLQTITFATAKANGEYVFDELEIINSVDDPILNLDYTISEESVTGFTIVLNGLPDTGNYSLKWKVRIPTTIQSDSVPVTIVQGGGGGNVGTVTAVSASSSTTGVTTVVTNPNSTPNIAVGLTNHTLDPQIIDYTPINLSGGTALTVGKTYYDTLTAARVITFTGTPNANLPATRLTLTVSGGPWTLTIPTSFPVGEVGSVTSRVLQNGVYEANWIYENSQYVLADSFDVASQTGDVGTGLVALNLFGGTPTYNLTNATNVPAGLDKISNTRGALLLRGVSGWTEIPPGTSGTVLRSNGAGSDPSYQTSSGSGSPGGSTTQIQFNDGGTFNGDSLFTYDKVTKRIFIPAGTSTTPAAIGADVLFDYFADAASSHTDGTEDDLFTDTISANTFAVDGDKLTFEYNLSIAGHAASTDKIKVYFGGTAIYDTTAVTYASGGAVSIRGFLIRDSSSTVRYRISCEVTGATGVVTPKVDRLTGQSFTVNNILKVTGAAASTGAAAGDITGKSGFSAFYPHNIVGGVGVPSGGGGSSTLLNGLRAYYKLEDLVDSANSQTLTNNNVVTFSAGKVSNAANFVSASSQSLSVASNSFNQMGAGDLTFCCWFKTSSSGGDIRPFYKGTFGSHGYGIIVASGQIRYSYYNGSSGFDIGSTGGGYNNSTYHFVLVTVDNTAGSAKLYINGSLDRTSGFTPGTSSDDATGIRMGTSFDGQVDEVGLWNRVLNSTEISNLRNAGAGTTYPFTGL